MDKIKAFFNNTIVKVVAWVLLAVVSVVLILGGASVADINKFYTLADICNACTA